MNKLQIYFFLLITFNWLIVRADAGPKLHSQLEIQFTDNNQIVTDFDSIYVVTFLTNEKTDTLFLKWSWQNMDPFENRFSWHDMGYGNNYVLEFFNPISCFKIFLTHHGKEYKSDFIDFIGSRSFHEFELTKDGKIQDDHNLFYAHWSYYFISFGVTLILEFLISFFLFRTLRHQFAKFILAIFFINCLTHPILWFIDSRLEIPLYLLEIGVMAIEIYLIKRYFGNVLTLQSCIKFGVWANLTSWWIGGIMAYIIYEIF